MSVRVATRPVLLVLWLSGAPLASAQEPSYGATATASALPSAGADALPAGRAGEQPGALGEPARALSNLPGLARAAYGSGELIVWGSLPGDTRTYVDGVEIPRLFHPGGLRSTVHPALVERISLVPGAFDARFGRGLGGVVQIDSVRLRGEGVHGELRADGIDTSLSLRAGKGPVHALVALRYGYLDRVVARLTPELAEMTSVPSHADGAARLSYQPDARTRVSLTWIGSRDALSRGIASSVRAEPNVQSLEQRDHVAYVSLSRRYADGARVLITPFMGYGVSSDENRFDGVPFSLETRSLRVGARASYLRTLGAVQISLGFDALAVRSELTRKGSLTLPAREGDVRAFGQRPGDEVNADRLRTTSLNLAPHASVALARGPFDAQLGFRLEIYGLSIARQTPRIRGIPGVGRDANEVFPEPRLSAGLTASSWLRLTARAGVHHQPPAASDLSPVFGNPRLGAQRALALSAGPELTLPQQVTLRLEGHAKWLEGLAVRSPDPTPRYVTALTPDGEGRFVGATLLAERQVQEGLSVLVSYSIGRTTRSEASGRERLFDFDQTHVATCVTGYRHGGWLASLRLRYATGAPRTRVVGAFYDSKSDSYQPRFGVHNAARLPDFFQLDLHLEYAFALAGLELAVMADALNATAQRNVEEFGYTPDFGARRDLPGLPFLATLGLRVGF